MHALSIHCSVRAVLVALPLVMPSPAAAQAARPLVSAPVSALTFRVTVGATEVSARAVSVAATMDVEGRAPVLLSLPAWTPGAYEISNFAKNVAAFRATQDGLPVKWDKLDPDTWRIVPERSGSLDISYLVKVDTLDTSQGWTSKEFAFFNGTMVFPYVEGRLETAATVVIRTEPTWRVATGMTPVTTAGMNGALGSPVKFVAHDFHDLVDHPFFVGRFDLDSAMVAGKWMRLATYPVGSVTAARRTAMWDALHRSTKALVQSLGAAPWTTYTVLQVADSGFGGMSALEHTESELAIVGAEYLDEPFVPLVHAHEIAHAWNVKRLRPADLTPYVYDRPQPTTWLWMSEGITDYYADLALVRGGVTDENGFLNATLMKIDGVAERPVTALEDASLSAWLGMRDGTADLYYDQGSLAGLALDILIRDASDNERSLDTVMRELWATTYAKGRGFTYDDFWNAITRAAGGKALGEFDRRYIDGREQVPWREWLPKAGWRIVVDSLQEPRLGVQLRADEDGVRVAAVDPAGAGARAGVMVDDVITHIGGRSTLDPDFGERWRGYWGKRPGAAMALTVKRGSKQVELSAKVEVTTLIDRRIEPLKDAGAKARRIRAGILKGN